jgi:hypothetical protein
MNMNGIYAQEATPSQRVESKPTKNGPSAEYKVGQELDGIILKVSDQVSIDFSGKQVNVSQATIPDAREGEIRKFQITEISNSGIVLKEVGSTKKQQDASGGNGIVFTQTEVDASAVLTTTDKAEEENESDLEDLSSKMTAKNYKDIQGEGISLESYELEILKRALERVKVQRSVKAENIKELGEQINLEVEQARQIAMGYLPDSGMAKTIADSLVKADLPVTQENVLKIANAMQLSTVASQVGDASAAYLIKNELEPTIENIYKAVHSGKTNPVVNKESGFNDIKDLVSQMVTEADFQDPEVAMKEAKWLFQSDLNITKENIQYKMDLENLSENLSMDEVADQAAQSLASGQKAEDALLLLRSKIKLEESRLKLSYDASGNMANKGIQVDTQGMSEQVETLKQLEKEFYKAYLGENTENVSDKIDMIEQTVATVDNLKQSSAYVLGETFQQRHEINLVQLNDTAIAGKDKYQQAEKSYEALMTAPRKDMGDSIQKAFQNVDSQLDLLGLEPTDANQRAVRILAYNQIELTTENITSMKAYDAKVNNLLQNMTPSVTTAMVKDGINPISVPIDELNQITKNYQNLLGDSKEVKFSEYLVDLESNREITKEQRDAYVGIYRLLHQVEASDGAAVGAVVKAGKEMTLNALLTEVRSSKRNNVNLLVNDEQGATESKGGYSNSITTPIDDYFSEMSSYQQTVIASVLQGLDGKSLNQVAEKYQDQIYDLPLEQLQQELNEVSSDEDQSQVDRKLEILQELSKDGSNGLKFLESFKVANSIQNIVAAKSMLELNSKLYDKADKLLASSDSLQDYSEELVAGLENVDEFKKTYDAMQTDVTNQLKDEVFAMSDQQTSATMVNDIKAMCDIFSLNQQLQSKEFYNIPMKSNDSIVNVNLTVVHNSEEKGKIRISYPTEQLGTISVEASIDQGQIKCLITSDTMASLPNLKDGAQSLAESMKELGYDMTQQHYSYEKRSQEQFIYASGNIYKDALKQQDKPETNTSTKTNTDELYQIAKQLITHLSNMA